MNTYSLEVQELLQLLDGGAKLAAMLAPSFPIDFPEEINFVGQLKRLGFEYVLEVAKGAVETNRQLLELIKQDPEKRYITNPCPTIVRLIKAKYPQLVQYLTKIDSPMSATARISLKQYPDHRPVFIGPCIAKKLEAKEDWPDLNILVLTFIEIQQVFDIRGIKPEPMDKMANFDLMEEHTRLYPISGGLAQSSCIKEYMDCDDCQIISGLKLVEEYLSKWEADKETDLLDILYCEGGCIGGPGVIGKLPLEERRQRVIDFWLEKDKENNH